MRPTVSIAALACAIVAAVQSPTAHAQTTAMVPPPPPPSVLAERPVVPNPVLLRGGLAILAVGYVPAAAVGLLSDHKGDANLLIPVAGPWIDLATRDCSGSVTLTYDGPVEDSSGNRCGSNSTEQAALIVDGIVQGIGTLGLIGSLVIPERRLMTWASPSPNFTFVPTSFAGRGMGAVAAGRF